jgi:hypothetical protein
LEHPILTAVRSDGFEPLGWFAAGAAGDLPGKARFLLLIGNAGPAMFARFRRERFSAGDMLDDWSRHAIGRLARRIDADAVFPFDTPPPPFLAWARRAGAAHVSPLGLNIHPRFGLWHAYRAALLFPVAFDLPPMSAGAHPCETCEGRPCLSACPVGAFTGASYHVDACVDHLVRPEGGQCMEGGCLARRACPVGRAFTYAPEQAQFHMNAFRATQVKSRGHSGPDQSDSEE